MNPQQGNLEGLLVASINNDCSMDMQLLDCEGNLQQITECLQRIAEHHLFACAKSELYLQKE
jgi:hypothetical protein